MYGINGNLRVQYFRSFNVLPQSECTIPMAMYAYNSSVCTLSLFQCIVPSFNVLPQSQYTIPMAFYAYNTSVLSMYLLSVNVRYQWQSTRTIVPYAYFRYFYVSFQLQCTSSLNIQYQWQSTRTILLYFQCTSSVSMYGTNGNVRVQ